MAAAPPVASYGVDYSFISKWKRPSKGKWWSKEEERDEEGGGGGALHRLEKVI